MNNEYDYYVKYNYSDFIKLKKKKKKKKKELL